MTQLHCHVFLSVRMRHQPALCVTSPCSPSLRCCRGEPLVTQVALSGLLAVRLLSPHRKRAEWASPSAGSCTSSGASSAAALPCPAACKRQAGSLGPSELTSRASLGLQSCWKGSQMPQGQQPTVSPGHQLHPSLPCLWGCSSQSRQMPCPHRVHCIGAGMAQAATILLAVGNHIKGFSQQVATGRQQKHMTAPCYGCTD